MSNINTSSEIEQVTLIVIVGGTDVKVKAAVNEPLEAIVPKALEKAEATGRPPADWDIKNEAGVLYDRTKLIGTYAFAAETVIYLSLRAGEAG